MDDYPLLVTMSTTARTMDPQFEARWASLGIPGFNHEGDAVLSP